MTQPEAAFEAVLSHLKSSRGFDFTGYKRSSLVRRMNRRMAQVGVNTYTDYLDYLELHADEFTALFNSILINVTAFFRDPEAWEFLRSDVLPRLISKGPTQPIRIWSAGCASGEEAYTLAMALTEMLGPAEVRERVKIYATDVDEEALAHARHGSYSEREIRGVPPELLDRYFDLTAGRYVFRKDLRRSVIFGRNDLVQNAPISRIDLLVSRNTLMYFNAETQARILARFHFALAETGVLFLGKAEMLLSYGALFSPVDLKRRIFTKAARPTLQNGPLFGDAPTPTTRIEPGGLDILRTEAMLAAPIAQIAITADGLIALANRHAEQLFGVSPRDVGRAFRDLDVSYRPRELRPYVEQAQSERRTVHVGDVVYARSGEVMNLDIQVTPLLDSASEVLGVMVAFHDVTEAHRLQDELEQANRQLETAYEELQSTNEELETTNEELQSTVEELETTNEELQSTNEELETMNEELQSTNDELQTINDELQDRSIELDRTNGFLEAILVSLRAGVVVLDAELQVRVWNRQAQELWGLRQDEAVGQHFLNLDIGLPTDRLRPMIRRVLGGEDGSQEATLAAVNRRGRSIDVRVLCSALRDSTDEASGVILTMEEISVREPAFHTDGDGR
jgi:two-component system CheB/CheR fusion protein